MTTESWASAHTFDLNDAWVRRVISWRGINGYSPAVVLTRFLDNSYSPDDVERVIELGLIGGGMAERDVEALLSEHVRGKPLNPNLIIATRILAALFAGAA
ncbi:GTA-gp10 family protein [Bradyrhizobium sp. cf659]|uniref:GTA-gp10 family protein n=1 Tax=Bradyrhizobium sp. cf659 TaxID=1761771 RepID=UPI0008DF1D52|nr:GTA-gp10 family protein [Bradyrhizobium sp. cf659]SFH83716.1 Phage tail tube protein, GTA-gp10 [Bradyrhizobium sp. cf659]